MNILFFIISEGLKGLFRSKFSTFLTIASLLLTLTLLNIYFLISQNILQKVGELRGRITIEAFLEDGLSENEITKLQQKILQIAKVDTAVFFSKDAALKKFQELFTDDYSQMIEENPLPASFQIRIRLDGGEQNTAQLISKIEKLEGIDEVIFHRKLLTAMNYYSSSLRQKLIFIGVGLLFISFGMLWINIKITLNAKARLIETMELVGAKRSLIRGPFYVQSIFEGMVAGVGSLFLCYLLVYIFDLKTILPYDELFFYPIYAVLISILLSFFTCFLAIRRQI
ncbi:permease-like cell division protein FtsX [candidate division KSB1 bacterium]|nr:permease-like cell division protein FtsX [candidate division KSB1 bacterium]